MVDAEKARGGNASHTEDLRPLRTDTPIVAYARLLGKADDLYSAADRQNSRHKHPAFRIVHDSALAAMNGGYLQMLHLVPHGDDRDLMILAGHASMMADQLNDCIPQGPEWEHADRLTKGIADALAAISATLSNSWPAGADAVAPLFPELAKSIRRDAMIIEARRVDAEGC